ncbi:hypothetical protein WJX74_009673 [Apatococcus lobatus]|uniref:Meiosis regulator and mRNA stability factor 1 n=1 Tax=Apatococcus lobatus TaxID=904363 RepID=A0AAW1QYZ2_9CHLO
MPPTIPVGRPQPKLSKLVAQQEQETEGASAAAKFVFWDLQNTPLPAELCTLPLAVLNKLCKELGAARLTVVTEVPARTELGAELLRALKTTIGVQLLTFLKTPQQAAGSTAADYELKRAIQRFLLSAPSGGIMLVLSSDINLLSDIYQAKDLGLQVHLLCEAAICDAGLLEAADSHQDWLTFLKGLFGDFSCSHDQTLPDTAAESDLGSRKQISPAEDWTRRTIGIFNYPAGTLVTEVQQHATAFSSQFGRVIRTNVKIGSTQQPYAIVNFGTVEAAQAALAHKPKPAFNGTWVSPRPWNPPNPRISADVYWNGGPPLDEAGQALPQPQMSSAEDLAGRTVAIFHYPKHSDPVQVSQHAKSFGSQFGEVLSAHLKRGSGQQPYVILNFASITAAVAAVEHNQRPLFLGSPVDPTPWRLPSGPGSEGSSRPGSATRPRSAGQSQYAEYQGPPKVAYPQASAWIPPNIKAGITAVRLCYPKGFCREHAKVHAAACASTMGAITSIWACSGSMRNGTPTIGIQFAAAISAAKLRSQHLPTVQGTTVTVIPWEGSRIAKPSMGSGTERQVLLLCANFPHGYQLQQAQAYAAKHLGGMDGINFAVATRQMQSTTVYLCVSTQSHARHELQQQRKTASGAEICFNSVTLDAMRTMLGISAETWGSSNEAQLDPAIHTRVALPMTGAQTSGGGLPVIAAISTTGSRNMFLGIPGITNVASGMTEAGRKFAYTLFDSQRELAEARDTIKGRLTDVDPAGDLLEGDQVAHPIGSVRHTMNLTSANGLFSFLRHKQGKQNLPAEATDALCCMAIRDGQHWQIGTPNTLQYMAEVYYKGEEVSQSWLIWSLSKLGVPAPFGDHRSQAQLLQFLGSLVQACENKLGVFHACVFEARLEILITAADKHGLAMGSNQLKMLSQKFQYRVIPGIDDPQKAWQRAQTSVRAVPGKQVFATTWSGGLLFCAARPDMLSAGIKAYEAACDSQPLPH